MKKLAILYSEYTPTIDAVKFQLDGIADIHTFKSEDEIDFERYDIVVAVNYDGETKNNVLKTHYSLLPSFEGDEPLKQAILSGVKVTGITVYYSGTKEIITQYPIFIKNGTHYDEILQELKYLEQTILPLAIKKILQNEPFEIRDLIGGNSCSGSCAGCKGCSN